MSKFSPISINVPDLTTTYSYIANGKTVKYSDANIKKDNVKMLVSINQTYGSQIDIWASAFDVPRGVIVAFIATESGGRMLAPNVYMATGLMQCTPAAIYEAYTKWSTSVKGVPVPQQAVTLIKSVTPELISNPTKVFGLLKSKGSQLSLALEKIAPTILWPERWL